MNNLITLNDADLAVAEFFKTNHIHFSASYNGAKKAFDTKSAQDAWTIKIGTQSFDFFTGTGHRLSGGKFGLSAKQKAGANELKELLGLDRLDNTIIKLSDNYSYAVKPTQASVLYCLLSDAEAGESNFYDYCDNFGYDQDSRKAFDIYTACCDTRQSLRKLFTGAQLSTLRELLQDY